MRSLRGLRLGLQEPSRSTLGRWAAPALPVAPALLVHGATRPTIIQHRECRKALNPSSTRRAGVISKRGWKRKFEDPTCVYRKLKLGRNGDEVRPGWQVT